MGLQDSPLLKAARPCPAGIRTERGIGVADAVGYVAHDDRQAALLLLEELGDVYPQPPGFWSLPADAARLLRLRRDADRYEWRCRAARSGALRAGPRLKRTEGGGRYLPIPAGGPLRPMWDVGRRTPEGEPLLGIAVLWVEGRGGAAWRGTAWRWRSSTWTRRTAPRPSKR